MLSESTSIDLGGLRRRMGGNGGGSYSWATHFEPQKVSLEAPSQPGGRVTINTPEKKLIIFALHLAILEKTVCRLGQLSFVWATVVLLGGFASDLKQKDFWFVTAILVIEGARLFTRSRELELEHQLARSFPADPSPADPSPADPSPADPSPAEPEKRETLTEGSESDLDENDIKSLFQSLFQNQPSLPAHTSVLNQDLDDRVDQLNELAVIPLFSNYGPFVVSKNIRRLLYWLQIFAAAALAALSLIQLLQQDYGYDLKINEKSALNVFYSLVLAEALIFLLEKGYWTWKIEHKKLFERVRLAFELDSIHIVSLRRFFYEAYSQCIFGSMLDVLKMDLGSFALALLGSDSPNDQIIGAGILHKLVQNFLFVNDTLRKIGSCTLVIERLIEMLNWKHSEEEVIRRLASEIVLKLATRKRHGLRVAAIPEAMESIATLLHTSQDVKQYDDMENYEFSTFNQVGLKILKHLARYHDNCCKIGNAPGLLARIIDLTSADAELLIEMNPPRLQIKTVRGALKVVKILACATGLPGEKLRRDISRNLYLVSNIKKLLQYGKSHLKLQMLGLNILTSLGMDEEAREKIGATGYMLRLIIEIFFQPIDNEVQEVCKDAGDALVMLILKSRSNCERMLREENDVVRRLVDALDVRALRVKAVSILRSLCAYTSPDRSDRLQIVSKAMPMVLKKIMKDKDKKKKKKLLEVSIGLVIQILKFSNPQVCENEIARAGFKDKDFVQKLVDILRRYENPESKVPRMRRFVIGLAIALMKSAHKYIELFRDLGMEQVLMRTAETTSELECFNVFSGSVGLGRHEVMISSLIDTALELLDRGSNSN